MVAPSRHNQRAMSVVSSVISGVLEAIDQLRHLLVLPQWLSLEGKRIFIVMLGQG